MLTFSCRKLKTDNFANTQFKQNSEDSVGGLEPPNPLWVRQCHFLTMDFPPNEAKGRQNPVRGGIPGFSPLTCPNFTDAKYNKPAVAAGERDLRIIRVRTGWLISGALISRPYTYIPVARYAIINPGRLDAPARTSVSKRQRERRHSAGCCRRPRRRAAAAPPSRTGRLR